VASTVLAASLVAVVTAQHSSANPIQYVPMDDGVKIAVSVHYPKHYKPGHRYPSVLEMSGYDGAGAGDKQSYVGDLEDQAGVPHDGQVSDLTSMLDSHYFTDDGYIVVEASIRGTGCSGGEFDLFSWRSALDGRNVIEWMARQRWSNGKVGLNGHSYSGITGFMIAETRPPHLVAATLSGLIDDVYRGITYPGGVSNYGFPLLWAGGYRLALDLAGGTAQPILREHDATCVQQQAAKSRSVTDDPVVNGLSDTDGPWFREHSLYPHADRINVPTWIWSGYDDEQTGPRGPDHLWEMLRGVPKRLLMGNSDHDGWWRTPAVWRDRVKWMDHWMGRANYGFGTRAQRRTSTATFFEIHDNGHGTLVPNAVKNSRTFPLEDTRWTDLWFGPNHALSSKRPGAAGGSDSYLSGTERYSWSFQAGPTTGAPFETQDAPDEVLYTSAPVKQPLAISGPITADLWLSSTELDTDMFVQLVDVAPDGSKSYLQRGLLKSSMRAIDRSRSDYTASGHMYRPFYSDSAHDYVTPGTVEHYTVEVWPVGWIFRPGHRIEVAVHAPPAVDSFYAYIPKGRAVGVNTLYHDAAHPSRITLPVVPLTGVRLGPPVACGQQYMVRCVPAS
jgi:putative CocE/NonD family hydrolase